MTASNPDLVHGLRAAAAMAGCSPSGLQKMVDAGRVRAEKTGRSYAFRPADLEGIRRAAREVSTTAPSTTLRTTTSTPVDVPPAPVHPDVSPPRLSDAADGSRDEGAVAAVIFADLREGKSMVDIVAERRIAPDVVHHHHEQWRRLQAVDDSGTATALERLGQVEAAAAAQGSRLEQLVGDIVALGDRVAEIEGTAQTQAELATRGRQLVEARLRALDLRLNTSGTVVQRIAALERQVRNLPGTPLLLDRQCPGCGHALAVAAACSGCGAGRLAT